MGKKLIINADDYGLCREVNDAIENLISLGRLQNVSVLVNSWRYDDAVAFLSNNRQCSVGIHLNVVEGVALTASGNGRALLGDHGQFVNLRQLLLRWMASPFAVSKAVEREWRAQIELLLKDGVTISHADSHQHIHAFPPFWRILLKLCREYDIASLRLPRERNRLRSRRVASFALGQSSNVSKTLYSSGKLVNNNHFLGFKRAGGYGEDELIDDVKNLKDGVTELVVHPSLYDGVPYPDFRGDAEYQALQSPRLWKQIEESNIELVTWSDISTNGSAHIPDEKVHTRP